MSKRQPSTVKKIFNISVCAAALFHTSFANASVSETEKNATQIRQAQQHQETDRFIVKFKENAATASLHSLGFMGTLTFMNNLSDMAGAAVEHVKTLSTGAHVLKLPQDASQISINQVVNQLSQDPRIEYIEPDRIMHIMSLPNDPRYNEQWHYFEANGGINLNQAWLKTKGKSDTVIAVIDTGVLPHEDLDGQILAGYDFITDPKIGNDGDGRDADATDPGDWLLPFDCGLFPWWFMNSSWHGTHVAGTIAAKADNNLGGSGIAPKAKILPVRVLGKCGGHVSDISDAIRWSAGLDVTGVPKNANPAQVINMSLGGRGGCGQTFSAAIKDAINAGTSVVVAAGNDATDAKDFSPANCPGVITVASSNRSGGLSQYSNFGSTVEIAAPGGETHVNQGDGILSTLNSGANEAQEDSYAFYQGTSMAAPHVAGVAALMISVNKKLTPKKLMEVMGETARDFPTVTTGQCDSSKCGSGIVDAAAAVKKAASLAGGGSQTPTLFSSDVDVAIPDNVPAGVESTLKVNYEEVVNIINVDVEIKHPYKGELKITLISPNGKSFLLKALSDEEGTNLSETYQVDASGVEAKGIWRLHVADYLKKDKGYIDAWSINFTP